MLDERISTCDQQLKEGQNRKAQQGIPDTELPDFLERQAVKAQRWFTSLKMRGPRIWLESERCSKGTERALDQVSQGGPASIPITQPSRMAWSQ